MSENNLNLHELMELAHMKKDNPEKYDELMKYIKIVVKDWMEIAVDAAKEMYKGIKDIE